MVVVVVASCEAFNEPSGGTTGGGVVAEDEGPRPALGVPSEITWAVLFKVVSCPATTRVAVNFPNPGTVVAAVQVYVAVPVLLTGTV